MSYFRQFHFCNTANLDVGRVLLMGFWGSEPVTEGIESLISGTGLQFT